MSVKWLRFKNNNGDSFPEWTPVKLGEVYTERNEKGNDSLPILSVSIHTGVSSGEMDEEELGKRVSRSEDKSLYKRVMPGDLAFNMMRAWQGAIGVVETEGMISPAYIAAVPSDRIFPRFMNYYMRTSDMIHTIDRQSYGLTDFRKRLYWNSFASIRCMLPSYEEQVKIADFLSELDDRIRNQSDYISDLEERKHGLISRLFKRELRFVRDDGKNYPDWGNVKLGELGAFRRGGTLSKADLTDVGIPCVLYGDLYTKYAETIVKVLNNTSDQDGLSFAYKNDLLFPTSTTADAVSLISPSAIVTDEKIAIGGDVIIFTPENVNAAFLSYQINGIRKRELSKYAKGTTIIHIGKKDIEKCNILLPCSEEQEHIVAFLATLDEQIDNEKALLDEWKNMKKGFLQQMFI